MINCKECNVKCIPINYIYVNEKKHICRECALHKMEGYYDRRPDEIEETN